MADGLLLVVAFACSVCGMAWFALAMRTHWGQVRGTGTLAAGAVRKLRGLGAAALLGSLALCLTADHVSMAALVWVMMLSLSAVLLALVLAYRPASLRFLVTWLA